MSSALVTFEISAHFWTLQTLAHFSTHTLTTIDFSFQFRSYSNSTVSTLYDMIMSHLVYDNFLFDLLD